MSDYIVSSRGLSDRQKLELFDELLTALGYAVVEHQEDYDPLNRKSYRLVTAAEAADIEEANRKEYERATEVAERRTAPKSKRRKSAQ